MKGGKSFNYGSFIFFYDISLELKAIMGTLMLLILKRFVCQHRRFVMRCKKQHPRGAFNKFIATILAIKNHYRRYFFAPEKKPISFNFDESF